jgi:hypothetical protein
MDTSKVNERIADIEREIHSLDWESQVLRLKLNRGEVDTKQKAHSWTCFYRMVLRMRDLKSACQELRVGYWKDCLKTSGLLH